MQYEADSAPALALKATIDRTEKRFANYAKAGLLCGADGLPHLISDPGLALKYGHAGEVFVSCRARTRLRGIPTRARGMGRAGQQLRQPRGDQQRQQCASGCAPAGARGAGVLGGGGWQGRGSARSRAAVRASNARRPPAAPPP